MSTVQRNARGQYQLDIDSIEDNSLIGNVVREEVEAFITKLRARLNTLSATDLTDDETSNFKDEIRSVLRRYMGGSTAKAAVSFVKKPNSWNLFFHDNFARIASQMRDQEQPSTGMTFFVYWFSGEPDSKESFSQAVRVVRDEYYQLSPDDRKNYTSLNEAVPPELGETIQSTPSTVAKRKKQLIKNMQSTVRIGSHSGWLKVWYVERAGDSDYDLL